MDDNREDRDPVQSVVEQWAWMSGVEVQVMIFSSAEEFLFHGESYDVCLLDIEMTGMDGVYSSSISVIFERLAGRKCIRRKISSCLFRGERMNRSTGRLFGVRKIDCAAPVGKKDEVVRLSIDFVSIVL